VRLVLNADVVIGALDGADPHHVTSRALFTSWQQQDATRLISVINLTEVLVAPAGDQRRLRLARRAIAALGVSVHQPGVRVGSDAARLRATHPISIPDAYCLATARHTGGAIASFDRQLIRAARTEAIAVATDRTTP
jgi:predicted nucleic acid-binding protein